MTLEQILKWKYGSFENYENIINEQEKLLNRVKKLNFKIEKAEDARSCFNYDNSNEFEKWKQHNDEVNSLIREKERLGIKIKENNERLQKEFY